MRNPKLPIAALFLIAGWACQDEAPSPTGLESAPSLAAAVAGPLSFLQVSAGLEHACGVATDGRAWCWGEAVHGQLGNGTTGLELCNDFPCQRRPVAVTGGLRFRHVSAGGDFTCGVTTNDRIYCWGFNEQGQLGAATPSRFSTTPVAVAGNRRYRQVRAGGNSACAITMARTAFCWGANDKGQLGNGNTTGSHVPVRVGGPAVSWAQLSIGFDHACGVTTDDRARCWGINEHAELGDGTTTDRLTPVAVAGGLRFAQIEAGFIQTCAVSTAGKGYCWGSGIALGDGSGPSQQHLTPVALEGSRLFDNVSAGFSQSCGVTRAGLGFCWGANGGTLGDGGTAAAIRPTRLAGDVRFRAISVGTQYSCGVATDAKAWCWGGNPFGNVGDGTTTNRSVPTPVLGP